MAEIGTLTVRLDLKINTVQKACAILLAEYHTDDVFRQAIIDSITSVTADTGLSERIADRLFDMEVDYADYPD